MFCPGKGTTASTVRAEAPAGMLSSLQIPGFLLHTTLYGKPHIGEVAQIQFTVRDKRIDALPYRSPLANQQYLCPNHCAFREWQDPKSAARPTQYRILI
jgi:hypothetical protein